MSKAYFSYVRVSTVRQGTHGTSLTEQRDAIQRYASRLGLRIVQEFEEKETAAQKGRPVFSKMLQALRGRKADGLIIHKIDRSARNLRDWAELADVIDHGVEVHFANDNLDLDSRGGRLSADIQAVVAADYIRNLREEVKKGFYGRLKQGFYPRPAPLGYEDRGAAVAKRVDPVRAPLIKEAFELYRTELFSLRTLAEELYRLGLRTKSGRRVRSNSLSKILHNPFYLGMMKIKSEIFAGRHEPIVSQQAFDQVQRVLSGKSASVTKKHSFVFRGLLRCWECQGVLTGERQKGFVYYRCHTRACHQTIREDRVSEAIRLALEKIVFDRYERKWIHNQIVKRSQQRARFQKSRSQLFSEDLKKMRQRRDRLTDAFLDGSVDDSTYVEKKNALVREEQRLREALSRADSPRHEVERLTKMFELANNACLSYESGNDEEKRLLVKSLSSNLSVKDKILLIKLKIPFQLMTKRESVQGGGAHRRSSRTLSRLLSQLLKYFESRKDQEEEEEPHKPGEGLHRVD